MLENFVNEAFSTIHEIAKPAMQDVAKDLDSMLDQIIGTASDFAPARFASGYLAELTGQDFNDYILDCYTVNNDLT